MSDYRPMLFCPKPNFVRYHCRDLMLPKGGVTELDGVTMLEQHYLEVILGTQL
jgi:hypothetical protein